MKAAISTRPDFGSGGEPAADADVPFRIGPLTLPAAGFDHLTFPRYRALLRRAADAPDPGGPLAVAAWLNDVPAGLALFSPLDAENRRSLSSLVTSPLLRSQGLGSRLLAEAEALLSRSGTLKLRAFHSSRMTGIAPWLALLRRAGWTRPVEAQYRLAGRASWALAAAGDWAPFRARLDRGGFSARPWSTITVRDREAIAARVAVDLTPEERAAGFDPTLCEAALLPEISLVLLRHGEAVGWIVGCAERLLGPRVFYYPRGYVIPELRHAAWLLGGVYEVCIRQAAAFGGDSLSIFEVASQNRGMRRFLERQIRRYGDHAAWTDIRCRSEKQLSGKLLDLA